MRVEGCHESNVFQRFFLCAALFRRLLQIRPCTSRDREDTNGLGTREHSSGVTTTRGPDMDSQLANVETKKQKVALDPHSCSKRAAQLVARPCENIACDGLLCKGMDRSGELEKVECCFAAVVGLPTPPVIDGGPNPAMLQAARRGQAHRARRTSLETCHVATHGSQ